VKNKIDQLIAESLAIEAEDAKQAGTVGFIARALTQATMPHKATPGCEFKRCNGSFSLTILSPSDIGLPYGSIPRLLMSWLTTEAVRTRSPVLELGPTLSAFMAELGLSNRGGERGDITRFRNQSMRLFCSTVSCRYEDKTHDLGANLNIVEKYSLWWNPKTPDQMPLWKSTVTLGNSFFSEIIDRPVPVDMRAIKALKRSPLALDIYCWLTYRLSYLHKPTEIPWPVLQMQFGADYATQGQGPRDFKKKFLHHLLAVQVLYPEAQVEDGERGLLLKPSKPHVVQLPRALPRIKNPPAPEPVPLLLMAPFMQTMTDGPHLRTATYERAKKAAPGWDVYELERQWREWITKKGLPDKPDAAFIAFCRKKYQRERQR
jgi:hypothetical protein